MTFIIIASVILGVLTGYFFVDPSFVTNMGSITSWLLCILLFSVGVDIGKHKPSLKDIKKLGIELILILTGGIAGTLFGGLLVGFIFGYQANESLAVAAGFGWYSLSGIMISDLGNPSLGAVAFLSNVWRELFAFILIPILAKVSPLLTLGPPGATSMDTTLPLISKSTSSEIAMIAFLNGSILSLLVPILVPFFYLL